MRNRLSLACCAASLILAGEVPAQVIPVKTVPVAEGDQFTFLPSSNRGMALVSIALRDSLLDPYTNPATVARFRTGFAFGAMTSYTISRNAGDGTTVPAGAMVRSKDGSLFAGLTAALQRVSPGGRSDAGIGVTEADRLIEPGSQVRTAETNRYVHALLGRSFGAGLTFAGSLAWSQLNGVDGAEHLYPQSKSVEQQGDVVGLRAGLVKDWTSGRSVEAVLIHNRGFTAHDVEYEDFLWNPATRGLDRRTRRDHNYDRTHLWGAQLHFAQAVVDSTWRVGALLTANRTTQLARPTLGLMTLARDPGQSSAFNAGIGVSRRVSPVTFAADVVYEPVWARGVDASNDLRYRFSNGILRAGARREFSLAPAVGEVQLGVQVHSIGYRLDKRDLLQPSVSEQRSHERWSEWVHTIGLGYRTDQFQVRYQWRLTSGVSRLGFVRPGDIAIEAPLAFGPGPFEQSMSMIPIRVTTQQLMVTVPLR